MIAVTGATGHIGNVLVRELLARDCQVRALILPNEDCAPIEGLKLERVAGDVRDIDSLVRSFRGADIVFHLAGIISISPGMAQIMQEVNVMGARNVVQACLKTGIRRLVYTSSVHAFEETDPKSRKGFRSHNPLAGGSGIPSAISAICETFDFDVSRVVGDYGKSKARATQEILKGIKQGLNTVVVFPSGVIGPYDYRPSEMGQLILDFARRKLPAYVDGAYDFVDVRDVATGLIAAAEKGRAGEGYLLTGEIIKVRDILATLESVSGLPGPVFRVPFWLARLGAMLSRLHYGLTRAKPRFTSYSLHVLRSNCQFSTEKARHELSYSPRPIHQSIADSYNWFRATGRL